MFELSSLSKMLPPITTATNISVPVILSFLAFLIFVFIIFPLLLACFYTIYCKIFFSDKTANTSSYYEKSKLFVGRVWHTRFLPKRHAFTYPIFMFALDLEEMMMTMDTKFLLWPLVKFQESDHLKNGEGSIDNKDKSSNESSSLVQRILRLVAERTNNKCQPTLETHRVVLLTHLTYYGYNFNPVSFYYIIEKSTNRLTAMVGEVSNTPWLEMYPYVLHPDSQDKVKCSSPTTNNTKYDYSFPKTFHVSPFMEMDFFYDWTFKGIPTTKDTSLTVINSLRRRSSSTSSNDNQNDSDDTKTTATSNLAFTAKLVVHEQSITPFNIAWQMIRFPIFCMIIQIWIHYEAVWLFIKGIVYVPHPEGSETAASKIIATIMIPFFAIRDKIRPSSSATKTTKSD